jgi:hypothetical protein
MVDLLSADRAVSSRILFSAMTQKTVLVTGGYRVAVADLDLAFAGWTL